jgi:hypothetical protein
VLINDYNHRVAIAGFLQYLTPWRHDPAQLEARQEGKARGGGSRVRIVD